MTPGARAIRGGVALSRMDHIVPVGLYGPAAADLVDRLVPRAIYLRDGGIASTVLLDADGAIFADVAVVADDADFVLLAEGPSEEALLNHIQAAIQPGEEVEVRPMADRYRLLAVTGPWAWELLEALAGPEILGLPFQSAVLVGDDICLRTGRTGEWAYLLMVLESTVEARWAELCRAGEAFDAAEADLDDLDTAALENGFFVIRAAGLAALSPVEAQLQWCLTPGKEGFLGEEATRKSLAEPPAARLTFAVADIACAVGTPLQFGDAVVGRVIECRPAGSRSGFLVICKMELAFAHSGLTLTTEMGEVHTISAPAVPNLSLALDPQRHRYASRREDFPGWLP